MRCLSSPSPARAHPRLAGDRFRRHLFRTSPLTACAYRAVWDGQDLEHMGNVDLRGEFHRDSSMLRRNSVGWWPLWMAIGVETEGGEEGRGRGLGVSSQGSLNSPLGYVTVPSINRPRASVDVDRSARWPAVSVLHCQPMGRGSRPHVSADAPIALDEGRKSERTMCSPTLSAAAS